MCDRTNVCLQYVHEISHNNDNNNVKSLKKQAIIEPPKPNTNNKSAFIEAASDIAKGIQKTSKTLSKLTKLVRRQGLFDDPTDEINNLVYRIKEDLSELNTKCDTTQQYIDMQKSSSYSNAPHKQSSSHSSNVVNQLKSELMNTTKDFKTILEIRSTKIKDQQKRKVELTGNSNHAMTSVMSTPSKGNHNNDSSNNNRIVPFVPSTPYDLVPSSSSSTTNTLTHRKFNYQDLSQNEEQQVLLVMPPSNMQYYESREQAVTEVEKTISELGTLFKRLAGILYTSIHSCQCVCVVSFYSYDLYYTCIIYVIHIHLCIHE